MCLVTYLLLTSPTSGASSDAEFFENRVRPVLIERCYECHSVENEKRKGGLLLDSKQGWMEGGDSGAAVIPGSADESLLIQAIRYDDPDLEMPPKGQLPQADVETLTKWVSMGAYDPRERSEDGTNPNAISHLKKGHDLWSFKPIVSGEPPMVNNEDWPATPIDRFILARLEDANITPNVDADPYSLIRRLYLTLTGLPPSADQIVKFVSDPSDAEYRATVDELLASLHFGEKWGRHWLDLARYSNSTGGGRSALIPSAWRYRDYVIASFNQDKPYDRFVQEQIAGDLLPYTNDEERAERLTATAFLGLGPKNLDLQDKELLRMNTVDEQIDTIGKTFLGMTLACARCHDHKFDPVTTRDYYAIAGILRSTRTIVLGNVSTLVQNKLPVSNDQQLAYDRFTEEKKSLEEAIKAAKKAKPFDETTGQHLRDLESRLSLLTANAPDPLPQVIGVSDQDETGDYNVCIRGNVHSLGEPVARGFMQIPGMASSPTEIPKNQSGRVELAEWITASSNPLTARVYANRIWSHLFGRTLVRTLDNFGTQGDQPTHPSLLDYLATQLIESGWSTKSLIREIVSSRTWKMSSEFNKDSARKDPENRNLWRIDRRRLEAESLRDAMLAISGQIKLQPPGMLLPKESLNDTALNNIKLDVDSLLSLPLRSVYLPVFREEGRNGLFDVFDFANPSFTVGKRNTSTLPTQALYMMNSTFVRGLSAQTAELLIANPEESDADRLDRAYLITLNRPPTNAERTELLGFLSRHASGDGPSADEQIRAWTMVVHTLFACMDFRYLN